MTCTYFFVNNFSVLHPNNFRKTIRWKCFLKDDCIRSSLIERQSFLNSKIDVDPIYCVLMFFPCFFSMLCAGIVQDAVLPSRSHLDPCDFLSIG